MNLRATSPQNLTFARRRGVLATLGCNRRCVVRVDLVVSRATQRAYKLPSRRIGRRSVTLGPGQKRFRVPLTSSAKRRLRRARSVGLTMQATWTGVRPAITKSRAVRLRR